MSAACQVIPRLLLLCMPRFRHRNVQNVAKHLTTACQPKWPKPAPGPTPIAAAGDTTLSLTCSQYWLGAWLRITVLGEELSDAVLGVELSGAAEGTEAVGVETEKVKVPAMLSDRACSCSAPELTGPCAALQGVQCFSTL